jgi:hypothetical protein
VAAEFDRSGVTGTPTVLLNGRKLEVLSSNGPITAREFTALVDKELGAK